MRAPAPRPSPGSRAQVPAQVQPRSPRPLGIQSPRSAPAGTRSRAPAAGSARVVLRGAPRQPGHSGPHCRLATCLGAPALTPSPGCHRGSPAYPGCGGPVPASPQAGKLSSPGAAVRTSKHPAGPCRQKRGRGRTDPNGVQGHRLAAVATWHLPHDRSEAAPRT